jgi:hypothetical protein
MTHINRSHQSESDVFSKRWSAVASQEMFRCGSSSDTDRTRVLIRGPEGFVVLYVCVNRRRHFRVSVWGTRVFGVQYTGCSDDKGRRFFRRFCTSLADWDMRVFGVEYTGCFDDKSRRFFQRFRSSLPDWDKRVFGVQYTGCFGDNGRRFLRRFRTSLPDWHMRLFGVKYTGCFDDAVCSFLWNFFARLYSVTSQKNVGLKMMA